MGLIHWAFNMPETRILGAPGWATSTSFNIDAEADSAVDSQMHNLSANEGTFQKQKMVQALLADRFKLVTHTETRELPIYALVVAKGRTKLAAPQRDGSWTSHGRGHLEIEGFDNSLVTLAEELSKEVGRDVVDKTGITGRYKIALTWAPDASANSEAPSAPTDSGPSIFTALQEQLGLKLEPQKGPVAVLVIDHAEMPSEN
jgi:uncharacterized protein (TIGR03435 family)